MLRFRNERMEAYDAVLFGLFFSFAAFFKEYARADLKFTGKKPEPLFKTATSEFRYHEVIVPSLYKDRSQLLSTFEQGRHIDGINIQYGAFGRNYTLDLKINRNLFSKSYIEKSYERDAERIDRPAKHKENHCFYHGGIHGNQHSMVAVSTCHGISGFVWDGKEAYHIEPAFDIDGSSHRIYRESDSINKQLKCGAHPKGHSRKLNETKQILHSNEVLHRMRREVHAPYDANVNTRYLELYLVNDYRTFDSNGQNLARQVHASQTIVNIVSKLYQPLNIYVALVGIETWTERDRFQITNEADTTLENFLHYRRTRINPKHHNDNAQLISHTKFNNGVVGKAIKGTICTFQFSGGVNLNLATSGQTAATVAHELGHNFGMDHDNYTVCKCQDEKCIMAATSGGVNTPRRWSSCSMASLQEAFEMGMDYCLKNRPEELFDGPVCGNGFTEENEECDCGLAEECQNRCCNASTCKLATGAQCATGSCCNLDSCRYKEAATLCRPSVGECDLPEFCWGNTEYCPANVYLENGVECKDGQSYCYMGKCRTHTEQCKLLWGTTGRVSDPVCFKHLNTNGSKIGNCGYNWTTNMYKSCLRDDVMCGLLHCVHQNEKLMFWKDNLAHATPATFLTIGYDTYICRGAMLDVGLDMPDPGMVPDGAKCEDRKICVNHKCTPISHLNFPTCPDGCSGRGVCNSRGNCHCDEGFGHPVCDAAGDGGSVDSGPIKINDTNTTLIGLLVFFLVVLPLLGVAAFATYYFRGTIFAWWSKPMSSIKHKQHSASNTRPERPSHPPPRQSPVRAPPPPYEQAAKDSPASRPRVPVRNGHVSVVISNPVLQDSTNKTPQPEPKKSHKPPPPVPVHGAPVRPPKPSAPVLQNSEKPEQKTRFMPSFKLSTFTKSEEKPASPSLSKEREPAPPPLERPAPAPVPLPSKKRELLREISNPVLISTTDRRSKHLVNLDSVTLTQPAPDSPQPTQPQLGNAKRPLPPRPMSMPVSEPDEEELEVETKEARKSMFAPSTKLPRPPPPPPKPSKEEEEEEEDITIHIQKRRDIPSEPKKKDSQLKSNQLKTTTQNRSVPSAAKSKTPAVKSVPESSKSKPVAKGRNAKSPGAPAKPDTKPNKGQWSSVEKPIFNPKSRPDSSKPGSKPSSASSSAKKPTTASSTAASQKASGEESIDDDTAAGAASVSGLAKMFEEHKKPLLGTAKEEPKPSVRVSRTPQTPPKPKKIRSVNV